MGDPGAAASMDTDAHGRTAVYVEVCAVEAPDVQCGAFSGTPSACRLLM